MNKSMLVLLMTLISFQSCKDRDSIKDCCVLIDNEVLDMSVISSTGVDLLDPSSNVYTENSIAIFELINSEENEIFIANSDAPKGFSIIEETDLVRMRIFVGALEDSDLERELLIEWEENTVKDTLNVFFENGGNYKYISKVVFNSQEVFSKDENDDIPYFQIQKN
ncbi:hypothetical protein [Aquimarina pacifica]|uniref:hypothetical protein n=1 Tax=Aquimarina pacifica TaxID=1296415 RepID=UPI0004ACEA95|nr:hypothetical protein [Aquimarina pacifica]